MLSVDGDRMPDRIPNVNVHSQNALVIIKQKHFPWPVPRSCPSVIARPLVGFLFLYEVVSPCPKVKALGWECLVVSSP